MILPKELYGMTKPEDEDLKWIISYNDKPYLISPGEYGKSFNVKHIRVKDLRSSMKLRMAWEELKERERKRWLGNKETKKENKNECTNSNPA